MVVEWTIAIAIASPRVHRFLLLQEKSGSREWDREGVREKRRRGRERKGGGREEEREGNGEVP